MFGFWTILIAHIMFCISFAVVTVKARLIGFDRHLEEAAIDIGANEWTTFRKVTLPLIAPAVLASLLLCFAISIDDFVVTYFNAGSEVTFPLFVWGAARIGAPAQVNVIGTAIFVVALAAMLFGVLIQSRRGRERMTSVQTTPCLPGRASAALAQRPPVAALHAGWAATATASCP